MNILMKKIYIMIIIQIFMMMVKMLCIN